MDLADGFHAAAAQFNQWGKRAHDLGMRFAFLNYDYEFRRFGDAMGFDILLKETDPNLVFFEMDCYGLRRPGSTRSRC